MNPVSIALILLAALLVVREVVARKRERVLLEENQSLLAQLRATDRLVNVGQLVSGLAQDLKSPLQGMLGSAEVLAAADPSNADSVNELNEIRNNVARAAGIVRNLLAFTETADLDRRWHDLNDLVRDALQHHRPGGDAKRPSFQGATKLQLVYVDGRQIEKVLATLLSHTARGNGQGDVAVTTRRVTAPEDRMVIEIDDPAVSGADDEAVWAGDIDACRRVLEAHGGSLELERQPAGGLRFHLEVPITELVETP